MFEAGFQSSLGNRATSNVDDIPFRIRRQEKWASAYVIPVGVRQEQIQLSRCPLFNQPIS